MTAWITAAGVAYLDARGRSVELTAAEEWRLFGSERNPDAPFRLVAVDVDGELVTIELVPA